MWLNRKASVVHRREAKARRFLQSATVGALRRRAVAPTVLNPAAHRMRIGQLRIDRQRALDGGASDMQGFVRRHRPGVGQRHIRFSKAHIGAACTAGRAPARGGTRPPPDVAIPRSLARAAACRADRRHRLRGCGLAWHASAAPRQIRRRSPEQRDAQCVDDLRGDLLLDGENVG